MGGFLEAFLAGPDSYNRVSTKSDHLGTSLLTVSS